MVIGPLSSIGKPCMPSMPVYLDIPILAQSSCFPRYDIGGRGQAVSYESTLANHTGQMIQTLTLRHFEIFNAEDRGDLNICNPLIFSFRSCSSAVNCVPTIS